jgi:lysophospholipase L1-like esterase
VLPIWKSATRQVWKPADGAVVTQTSESAESRVSKPATAPTLPTALARAGRSGQADDRYLMKSFIRVKHWVRALAFLTLAASTLATVAQTTSEPIRIVVIGDSTVCEYPTNRPDRGWGMFVQERFKAGTVQVINLAASGRSTKTFIQQGRWKQALEKKPNYVLIQFGHNDSHAPEKPESTDAATDYREYLRIYIEEARGIGAVPILVTPMVRRTFAEDGTLQDNLKPYAGAMKAVGAEKQVAVIDLHTSSWKLVEKLGPTAAAALANKESDTTHFNEKGARAMADLVMKELASAAPELASRLKP